MSSKPKPRAACARRSARKTQPIWTKLGACSAQRETPRSQTPKRRTRVAAGGPGLGPSLLIEWGGRQRDCSLKESGVAKAPARRCMTRGHISQDAGNDLWNISEAIKRSVHDSATPPKQIACRQYCLKMCPRRTTHCTVAGAASASRRLSPRAPQLAEGLYGSNVDQRNSYLHRHVMWSQPPFFSMYSVQRGQRFTATPMTTSGEIRGERANGRAGERPSNGDGP